MQESLECQLRWHTVTHTSCLFNQQDACVSMHFPTCMDSLVVSEIIAIFKRFFNFRPAFMRHWPVLCSFPFASWDFTTQWICFLILFFQLHIYNASDFSCKFNLQFILQNYRTARARVDTVIRASVSPFHSPQAGACKLSPTRALHVGSIQWAWWPQSAVWRAHVCS